MAEQIRTGTTVEWNWTSGVAQGKVTAIHHDRLERTIKGSKIVRNGSQDDPALELEQDDGTRVLKLRSEVRRASLESVA
jgi:hypothetical protein